MSIFLAALSLPVSAQSVADVAAGGACSTAGVEAISQQLANAQQCLRPGAFVRFAPHPGITLSSSRVHPYLQASARDALHAAVETQAITINSAFRTLADQYVLFNSGGCGLAARPGASNHQSGRAIDVADFATVRPALEAAGCEWFGSSDPVHFDCPGEDLRSDAVLTFQRLWNANNPGDLIAEDGLYGPQTDSRLASSPAAGFSDLGCTCEPRCEGSMITGADCVSAPCPGGVSCAADGVQCADATCAEDGARCEDAQTVVTCTGGVATRSMCPASEVCVAGSCQRDVCAGVDGPVCADVDTLVTCSGGAVTSMMRCGCTGLAGVASCALTDAGARDIGSGPFDASVERIRGSGCAAASPGELSPLFLLLVAARRRRSQR